MIVGRIAGSATISAFLNFGETKSSVAVIFAMFFFFFFSEEAVFYTIMYSDELTNETFDISTEAAVIEVINNGAKAVRLTYG